MTTTSAVRNVLSSWGAFAFSVAVNFFLAPFVVRSLGDAAYGTWVLLASLVGYMGLLDLGVRSAVLRFVARNHARGEHSEAAAYASAGITIFGCMGLAAVVLTVVGAFFLNDVFQVPAELANDAQHVLVVGGLTIAVSLLTGVYGGTIAALQRFDLLALLGVAGGVIRAVAVVVALRAGSGLLGLAYVQLGVTLLQFAFHGSVAHRIYPQLRICKSARGDYVAQMFSFGAYSSVLHISGAVIFAMDSAIIGAVLPVAMITYFAIPSTLGDYTRSIIASISQTITPQASALEARQSIPELERIVLRAANMATLVVLPIALTFLIRGSTFIGLWMDFRYASLSGQVLEILAVALVFDAARRVAMSALIGMNRHRRLAPFYVAEAAINLCLSVLWIRSMGLIGVALGTAIPNLVTALVAIPWLVRESLGTRPGRFWFYIWLRPIVAMIPFAAGLYLVERAFPARSLLAFFGGVIALLPIAVLCAWYVGINAADRQVYRVHLSRRLGQVA